MPYFRDDSIGTMKYGLQDFSPTSMQSLDATASESSGGNPTELLYNVAQLKSENQDERLSAYDAANVIKDSGIRGLTAKDGEYTKSALDMLIERKRQEQIRQDVLSRTEYSWSGTPIRALATLGAAVLDPVNLASAFIPVVGEERAVAILGRTAAGSLERAMVRTGIGITEGTAGAAVLEPFQMYGHSQLQDDYTMADSLTNLAFGGVMGGVLHASGGHLADLSRSTDPYARFSGLSAEQVKTVMDFEHGITSDTPASTISEATADWTPRMREAAGFDHASPNAETNISRDEFKSVQGQYSPEVLRAILDRQPEAPFAKVSDLTPEGARQMAAKDVSESMHAALLGDTGNRAALGDVQVLKEQAQELRQQLEQNNFKEVAKQRQQEGLSRKAAESQARKDVADSKAELQTRLSSIEQKLETNRSASQAEQHIAELRKGNVPAQFEEKVQNRANQLMAQRDIAKIAEPPARTLIDNALPEARQAAFKSALAQMVNGRMPEVDMLIRKTPTLDELKSAANRQSSADSLAIGDKDASIAADARLKQAPKDQGLQAAEAELQKSQERFEQLKQNLLHGGMDEKEIARIEKELNPYDEAVKMADNYGKAVRAAALCGVRS